MINVIVAGVGGQGIQIASRMLCVLASLRTWDVLSYDEFGLAEMGRATASHVRLANRSEDILTPKITRGTADLLLAFEPMEAARRLPFLARNGQIVTAISTIQPPSASANSQNYTSSEVIHDLKLALNSAMVREIKNDTMKSSQRARLFIVNNTDTSEEFGDPRVLLPTMLIAQAIRAGCLPFTKGELAHAMEACVIPEYHEPSMKAMSAILDL